MGNFLDCLYEPADLLEIRFIPSRRRLFELASDLPKYKPIMQKENGQRQCVYISANPRRRKGGKAADVALARSVFTDLEQTDPAAAAAKIAAAGLPVPTVSVNSGHGVHCYWRLHAALEDLTVWTAAQKHLAALLGGDPKVKDWPRMMRLPGFMNHKSPIAQCLLVNADPQRRYRLEDLMQQSQGRESREQMKVEKVEREGAIIASVPSSLSVLSVDSVLSIADAETAEAIKSAISLTLPKDVQQRHRLVFKLARALKAVPALSDAPLLTLKAVVREWHRQALPVIRTKPWEETWSDFVAAWPHVLYPLGDSPLDRLLDDLEGKPPPPEAAEYDSEAMKKLVALLSELQRQAGDGPIFLDSHKAGQLLTVDPVSIWRWMKMLQVDGLLEKAEAGRQGRCARWFWKGR